MKIYWCMFVFLLFIPCVGLAELPVGEVPPAVTLQGDDGSKYDGTPWKSSELQGKVFCINYLDVDERKLNKAATDAVKALKLPPEKLGMISILNIGATWMPSGMIKSGAKKEMKKKPDNLIVFDDKKVLVKKWNLKDDSYNIIITGADGKVLFSKDGKFSDADMQAMLTVIKANVR